MVEFQTVEIVLEGLAEKDSRLTKQPGKLRVATNVEFDKLGRLNKRRGYTRLPITSATHDEITEGLFCNVNTLRGELVLHGSEYVYSVVSRSANVSGASIARRGPSLRGNFRIQHVTSTALSEATP